MKEETSKFTSALFCAGHLNFWDAKIPGTSSQSAKYLARVQGA